MKCSVIDLDNKAAGSLSLDASVFGLKARKDILARMVNWQLAKRRGGNHKTKSVSEIRGTTAKPWKQKGLGKARAGSLRSVQFRGGAVSFGPVVRSHAHGLTKKVRRLALKTALSVKQSDGKLVILDQASLKKGTTKTLANKIAKLGWESALIIDGPELDQNFARAASNLQGIDVLPQQGANVFDILRCDTLVLTKDAVKHLEARLK
ncbi:MAG: 50S ribosomal protein L4 [Alphaproteobacteria bacterium]|nr:50S ribosomal protein L4 [Alphaproteobacteria bacterium]